jgi:catechol 2,3-dioxygenase-like lactoylglutathione lyase family enzyme
MGDVTRPQATPGHGVAAAILVMMRTVIALDHVQLAAPAGCEAEARRFYGDILGLPEVEKPEPLRSRGGCWFRCGAQQVHIGVEVGFRPARKAHPAFRVSDLAGLRERLAKHGIVVRDDEAHSGVSRFYVDDPWGNRLEFFTAD